MEIFLKNYFAKLVVVFAIAFASYGVAQANDFDKSDERIKTMVYNKNEVYTVLTRYGFATAIELSRKEKVQAISIGDSVGWKLTPAKNRIFVKPLLENGNTNLSIITDKRTYQIELIVSSSRVRNVNHAYVVRFFYPSEQPIVPAVVPESYQVAPSIPQIQPVQQPIPFAPVAPIAAPPIPQMQPAPTSVLPEASMPQIQQIPQIPEAAPEGLGALPGLGSLGIQPYNFNYTLTGPEYASPRKIFDDGNSTYFEFESMGVATPQISVVTPMGTEQPISVRMSGNKYVVDAVAPKFVIRNGSGEQICIFNEAMLAGGFADVSIANTY